MLQLDGEGGGDHSQAGQYIRGVGFQLFIPPQLRLAGERIAVGWQAQRLSRRRHEERY